MDTEESAEASQIKFSKQQIDTIIDLINRSGNITPVMQQAESALMNAATFASAGKPASVTLSGAQKRTLCDLVDEQVSELNGWLAWWADQPDDQRSGSDIEEADDIENRRDALEDIQSELR